LSDGNKAAAVEWMALADQVRDNIVRPISLTMLG
jgi:hypothetical protein